MVASSPAARGHSQSVTESQEEGAFLTPTLTPLLPQATTLHRKGLFAVILLPRASHVPFKGYLEMCKKAKTESNRRLTSTRTRA